MEGFVQRMLVELKELYKRTSKLQSAIKNKDFMAGIAQEDRLLLVAQCTTMETYLSILRHRLWRHAVMGNCTFADIAAVDPGAIIEE